MFPERIETDRLILRPVAAGDALAMFHGWTQDAEVTRFLPWRPHRELAETEAFVAQCLALPPDRERVYLLVERKGDGTPCGSLALRRPARHRVGFGYLLARTHWRRGLMSEALAAAASWALAQPEVWRFADGCDVENHASARVMEKAGLSLEGVRRRYLLHPNLGPEPRDCLSYARVR